jgi:hypothetical protein
MVIDAATKQFCGIPFRGTGEARASGQRAQHTQQVAARYSTMLPTAASSIGAP